MRIIEEGLISLQSLCAALIVPLVILPIIDYFVGPFKLALWTSSLSLSYAVVNAIFFFMKERRFMPVVIRASFLGLVLFSGVCLMLFGSQFWPLFGWYLCVLAVFHYGEYICIAITNPNTLTTGTFILTHSFNFVATGVVSWVEFLVEHHFIPALKDHLYISIFGTILCVLGELLRKSAMCTLRPSYNHIVQTVKKSDHVLVTHGVFSFCRHPGYTGWYYWCLGTQLILVNPFCVVFYLYVCWSFLRWRVLIEEKALLNFFSKEYVEYKKRVHSGLPFNDGINLEE